MVIHRCAPIFSFFITFYGLIGASSVLAHPSPRVELHQTLHFSAPGGEGVQVDPGSYEISYPGDNQLRLKQAEKEPLAVHAQKGTHTESLTEPEVVLKVNEDDDTLVMVMLLLPDGTGWEVLASTTGVMSRGSLRLMKKRNLSRALRYRKRPRIRMPASPSKPRTRFKLKRKPRITVPQNPNRKLRNPKNRRPLKPYFVTKNGVSFVADEIIVKLHPGKSIPSNVMKNLGIHKKSLTSGGATLFQLGKELQSGLSGDPLEIAKKLAQLSSVAYAQPNFMKSHALNPKDELFLDQWHYFENGVNLSSPIFSKGGIGLPGVWDTTTGDRNIVVAVLDTGIVRNHPDIASSGNLLPGFDMISNPLTAKDGNGRDSDPTDPGDSAGAGECPDGKPRPDTWHGTHVAGTVGVGGTNNRLGVSGVSWEVRVLPVRVLGKCGGSTTDINDGIRWAAGLPVDGVPPNPTPARIINLSLSETTPCHLTDPNTEAVIKEVVAKTGAVIVAAAGNADAGKAPIDASLVSPAGCPHVITVAASDGRGHLAPYSNFGPLVDILAPGGDLGRDDNGDGEPDGVLSLYHPLQKSPLSSTIPPGFAYKEGTSMAAPHVSGVLALWLAVNPRLTTPELLRGLKDNAFPRTREQCPKLCGAGLLNANNRSLIQPKRPIPPTPIQPKPPVKQCEIRTSEIVHSLKIDIGDNDSEETSAKQAMFRMLIHGDLETRREASGMVKATESGALAGIFQASKGPVASRGLRMTPQRGWWTLIPKGERGMCLKEPGGEPPMIIYRNQDMPPSVLDDTLKKAWRQCGLPAPDPPCTYIKDMGNKEEQVVPTTGGV